MVACCYIVQAREETESRGQMEKMDEGSWNMCKGRAMPDSHTNPKGWLASLPGGVVALASTRAQTAHASLCLSMALAGQDLACLPAGAG